LIRAQNGWSGGPSRSRCGLRAKATGKAEQRQHNGYGRRVTSGVMWRIHAYPSGADSRLARDRLPGAPAQDPRVALGAMPAEPRSLTTSAAFANLHSTMADISFYRRPPPGTQPAYLHPPYTSSLRRAPTHAPIVIPQTVSEVTGPAFTPADIRHSTCDLTVVESGHAIGERIIVNGRALDQDGRPVRHTLVEIWQANAAGRYRHRTDQHDAPLDPHFVGCGHVLTDAAGWYRFVTIKPGPYPWNNHPNAWRPAHIHFSIFGPAFATRLVTQMYFPGDPLLAYDPIYNCTADAAARTRLVSTLDLATTVPGQALGYRFDLVLRGEGATPMDR
jgi:protocatechuate 3,4-dioxygenase, beta subunit